MSNNKFVYIFAKLILQVGKLARHLGSNECELINAVHTLRNINIEAIPQSPGKGLKGSDEHSSPATRKLKI